MTATALAHLPLIDWNDAPLLDGPLFDRPLLDGPRFDEPVRPDLRLVPTGSRPSLIPRDLALVEVHRRRRFIALLAATIVAVVVSHLAGVSLTSFGPAAAPAADPAVPVVHVVLPGDSYGSIAASLGLSEPAQAAERLRAANGGGELVVGQRLVVSAGQLDTWGSASSQVPHENDVVGQ